MAPSAGNSAPPCSTCGTGRLRLLRHPPLPRHQPHTCTLKEIAFKARISALLAVHVIRSVLQCSNWMLPLMHAGGEAQTADDADMEAPAAKRRKGRKGKKVVARAAAPGSSPGKQNVQSQCVPCRQGAHASACVCRWYRQKDGRWLRGSQMPVSCLSAHCTCLTYVY